MGTDQPGSALRIVFFGTRRAFSVASLLALLGTRHSIVGVVCGELPGARVPLRARAWRLVGAALRTLLRRPRNILSLARRHRIPSVRTRNANGAEVVEWVRARSPDLTCIAALPQLLKAEMLSLPRIGTVNLHPAPLPRYRGPAPLFWMARAGETEGGVTVHWVDLGEDTGPIILQEPFAFPSGMTIHEMFRRSATAGAATLARAVDLIAEQGKNVPARVQGPGFRNSVPRPEDAELDPAWGSQRIRRFVRLVGRWRTPSVVSGGRRYEFDHALWRPEPRAAERTIAVRGRRVTLTCDDGTVVLWKRGWLARAWEDLRAVLAERL